jgi:Mn2+/Fe2+ NRAMP family transporter
LSKRSDLNKAIGPGILAACGNLFRQGASYRRLHQFWIVVSAVASIIIVQYFAKSLIHHLSFAATVSFLTSPFLAAINFKVMCGDNVPAKDRPGLLLSLISWAGLFLFVSMTLGYLYVRFYRNGA